MKTSFLSWTLAAVALSALVACGDDTNPGTGGGDPGAGGGGGGTTAAQTTAATTGGNGGGNTTSQGGGGSGPECEAITPTNIQPNPFAPSNYDGDVVVGADLPDSFTIQLYGTDIEGNETWDGAPGTYDLSEDGDDNYATCSRCVLVFADLDEEGAAASTYLAQSGTLEILEGSDALGGLLLGSLTDVQLVEVTIDPDTFESTPVDGGSCLSIDSLDIEAPPVVCDSGVVINSAEVVECLEAADGGCEAFEACSLTGEDVGACVDCIHAGGGALCDDALAVIYENDCFTPPDDVWTCDDAAYWDGETCDCTCGTGDPDCDFEDRPIEGCADGELCGPSTGLCVPGEWTCNPDYYAAEDGCDCSCGLYDTDCDVPDANVYGCDEGQTCGEDTAICEGELAACDSATAVVGTTFSGDNTDGPVAPRNSCSFDGTSDLFTFTPAVSGTYTITVTPADDIDLTLAVRSNCEQQASQVENTDAMPASCVDNPEAGGAETITVALTGLVPYTIVVSGFFAEEVGAFTGTITTN